MDTNILNLVKKIYLTNDILSGIIKDLQLLLNNTLNNIIINGLRNTISKINFNNLYNQEIIYSNGRYIGQIVNGVRDGKGIYYFNDGSRYEGYWKNNKRHGKGCDYYNNGERYEGEFRNDKFDGKGIYYYKNSDRY